MIDLAPLLRGLSVVVVGRGYKTAVLLGLGVALGLEVLGLARGRRLGSLYSRHCLVEMSPIGPCGYATGVEFVAHLSRASGFSQVVAAIRWQFRATTCFSLAWTLRVR